MSAGTEVGKVTRAAGGRSATGRMALLGLKTLSLGLLLFLAHLASSSLAGVAEAMPASWTAAGPAEMAAGVFAGSLVYSIALSFVVVHSTWSGWRLVLALFWVVFGIGTLLTQIESVAFLQQLASIIPPALIPKLVVQGTIFAVLAALLTSLVHGRLRRPSERLDTAPPANPRRITRAQWGWRLAAIAAVYVILYVSAGLFIFIPLAGSAFEEYYGQLELPAWVLALQVGRAMIWAAVALPVIKMMPGPWWRAGLGVALLFSLLMSALMIGPNPLMPDRIRLAHLAELTVSNFLFGWAVAWLLRPCHSSPTRQIAG